MRHNGTARDRCSRKVKANGLYGKPSFRPGERLSLVLSSQPPERRKLRVSEVDSEAGKEKEELGHQFRRTQTSKLHVIVRWPKLEVGAMCTKDDIDIEYLDGQLHSWRHESPGGPEVVIVDERAVQPVGGWIAVKELLDFIVQLSIDKKKMKCRFGRWWVRVQ